MALLFGLKLLATTVSLGCGASGGIFSPSLYLGATLGGGFAALAHLAFPHISLTFPSAAIVGMAAMVGAGTGGVMTAIVMIFEMTRDYAIIVPVIVAVAIAAGVRRALVNETIYTVKLRHRGHRIPKERHVNLYLVQQAQDVMERAFLVIAAGTPIGRAYGDESSARRRRSAADHRRARRAGGRPGPAALRPVGRGEERPADCRSTTSSTAHGRLPRRRSAEPGVRPAAPPRASAAIVFAGEARPRTRDVVGVITKRAIADTVIDNYED